MNDQEREYMLEQARTHLFTTEERRAKMIRECKELIGSDAIYLPIERYIYKTRGFPQDFIDGFEMGYKFYEELFSVPFESVEKNVFKDLFGSSFNPFSRKKR